MLNNGCNNGFTNSSSEWCIHISQALHSEQKSVCDTPRVVFQITGSARGAKESVILRVWYFKSQALHSEQKRACDTPSVAFQITGSALGARKSL